MALYLNYNGFTISVNFLRFVATQQSKAAILNIS